MTIDDIKIAVIRNARKQAKLDLSFSGCKPLAKLSEDEKRAVCAALEYYAETGATRAVQWMAERKLILL